MDNAHVNDKWAVNGKPGHYNDADMLEVGNGNSLTLAEQRSHFVRTDGSCALLLQLQDVGRCSGPN